MTEKNSGSLQIRVYTAGGALPVPGARTVIRNTEGQRILGSVVSDRSGSCAPLAVATPPRENSLSPEGAEPVCSFCDIITTCEGYFPVTHRSIPVYEGVTSVQGVEMIPASSVAPLPGGITDFPGAGLTGL